MNSQISKEIKDLSKRLQQNMSVTDAQSEYYTVRRILVIAKSVEDIDECVRARYSVVEAVKTAKKRARDAVALAKAESWRTSIGEFDFTDDGSDTTESEYWDDSDDCKDYDSLEAVARSLLYDCRRDIDKRIAKLEQMTGFKSNLAYTQAHAVAQSRYQPPVWIPRKIKMQNRFFKMDIHKVLNQIGAISRA